MKDVSQCEQDILLHEWSCRSAKVCISLDPWDLKAPSECCPPQGRLELVVSEEQPDAILEMTLADVISAFLG